MFGNGSGEAQPQDTKSLWGDMFGLGGLMKVITDPALVAHAHAMMQATIEGANSSRRIELKLDRLLQALGHEISDINSRFASTSAGALIGDAHARREVPAQFQPAPAALLVQNGAHGAGGHPSSTGAVDGGSGVAPGSAGPDVSGPELRGDGDPTGELR